LNPAWPVRIEGRERIDRNATHVMVANHQSLLDILVFFRLFVHFKWVSKIENFSIPFIGWNMWLNRYIPLKRGDKASIVQMLRACRETLAEGNSIMMFPEGTRSSDGRLRRFKLGAFELAKDSGKPILPLVMVLDAIPPESFADEPVEELCDRVRTLIAAEIEKISTSDTD
jgi:1-acyl-sn-glycerol-3-phosphate acyltransferase